MTPPRRRRTVAEAFSLDGTGVHTGAPCTALVQPTAFGGGIFFSTPYGRRIRANPFAAVPGHGMTVLKGDTATIGMVEHLMAAFVGVGVTDVDVCVFGPELPILDGSARRWVEEFDRVGLTDGPEVEPLHIDRVIRVAVGDSWAEMRPSGVPKVTVHVDFGDAVRGSASVELIDGAFAAEVAWARTFAMERDVEVLKRQGRGRGATLENTLLVRDDGTVANPAGLRAADEIVRHKLLDAVGDLGLLGRPVLGHLVVNRGSHRLHQALVQAVAKHA